jgi:uncharacterized membrane protein
MRGPRERGVTLQRFEPSRVVFAILIILIGLWGLVRSGFVAIWAPGIGPAVLRLPIAFGCSLVSFVTGIGLLWPRFTSIAARMLLAFLCLWLVCAKGLPLVRAPTVLVSWESLGEMAVVLSAGWALAVAVDRSAPRRASKITEMGPNIVYGLALIAFGAAHLGYSAFTASLVPAWLPWHLAWVYLTAATYIAAGIALVVGPRAQLAATLSAVQMALFGLLVWLPRIALAPTDADTLNETTISFMLAASGWVIATAIAHRHAADASTTGVKISGTPLKTAS